MLDKVCVMHQNGSFSRFLLHSVRVMSAEDPKRTATTLSLPPTVSFRAFAFFFIHHTDYLKLSVYFSLSFFLFLEFIRCTFASPYTNSFVAFVRYGQALSKKHPTSRPQSSRDNSRYTTLWLLLHRSFKRMAHIRTGYQW